MNKPKIIILEGSQGVGKSTICHMLREKMKYTTLLDLSAVEDKTKYGSNKMFNYHTSILDTFYITRKIKMNYVCCRSYMSEKVFCNLGFKPYDFKMYNDVLIAQLETLTNYYDVYFILLTSQPHAFDDRLNSRDKAEYVKFSVDNSMAQQEEYKKELDYLAKHAENVKCFTIENNDLDLTINSIKDIILKDMVGDDK